ncbi:MAG: apolipoprotein N-acyltransferase [bacterium]|nr:apolipoprotein N-acyltransferase [bacterium]
MNKQSLLYLLAALISGFFLSAIFDPFNEFGILWVALVPLLLVTRKASPRAAFWTGWLTGIIAWAIQLHWLSNLTITGGYPPVVYLGSTALILYLGFYIAIFAYLSARLRQTLLSPTDIPLSGKRILIASLLEPALWVALEALRSNLFTGFAWNPLGLAFTMNLPVFQLATIGGVGLVSALIVALNEAVTTLVERITWSFHRKLPEHFSARLLLSLETCLPFLCFLVAFLWGAQRIKAYDALLQKDAEILDILLQSSYNPTLASENYSPVNLLERAPQDAAYINLLKGSATFDLWLTPESSFVHYDLSHLATPQHEVTHVARTTLQTLARTTAPILLGGTYTIAKPQPSYYNASLLITDDAFNPQQHLYRKRHLVPFGEYIPFDKIFPSLQTLVPTGISCSPGDDTTITLPSGHRFGPLICFDDTDAKLSRDSVLSGAQFLVNTSNDAWFVSPEPNASPSIEPLAHLRQAIARCVETGVPMIRTSNAGGAAYIDAVGRIAYVDDTITQIKNYSPARQKLSIIYENQAERNYIYTCKLPITSTPFAVSYLTAGETIFTLPCLLFTLGFIFWGLIKRFIVRPNALTLLLSSILLLVSNLRATTIDPMLVNHQILPTAAMAIDDNNLTIAEETAALILDITNLAPDRRAKAEEILIRTSLENGHFDDVIQRVNNCPELAAERRFVFLMLAHLGKKEFEKVNALYEQSTSISPSSQWGLSALRIALIADLALEDKIRAQDRFKQVNDNATSYPEIQAANALAWHQAFPSPAAREALLQAAQEVAQGGLFLECALQLPNAFEKNPDTRLLALLKETYKASKTPTEIKVKLAFIIAQITTDNDEKIAFAKIALESSTDDDKRNALLLLGNTYLSLENQQEKGLQALQEAILINPSANDAPYIQLKVAETYLAMGEINLALKAYEAYRQSYNCSDLAVRYLQGHGRALLQHNDPIDAAETFAKAIALITDDNKKKIELLAEAAHAATLAKRYDKAINFLQQRIAIDVQQRPMITLSMAELYERNDNPRKAADAYATVCNMTNVDDETQRIATLRLGDLYIKTGRINDAITRYSASISRFSEESTDRKQLLLARAAAYYAIANYKRAYEDFAIAQNADQPNIANEARFFLVLCLYHLGRDEEARTLAEDYISHTDDNERLPDILLWLAKSDFNQGNYSAASKGFTTFINRWGNDPRVSNILYFNALANSFDQNYHATLHDIARLIKEYPNAPILPDARFLQAQVLIQHARHGEARDLLFDLIAHNPNATWIGEAYGLLGDCQSITAASDASRLDAAITAYRNAITRLEAFDADKALCYRYKIGRIYEKQNYRPDAAEEYYRLLYTLLNQPTSYTNNGILWGKRALVRLDNIETAAGHTDKLNALKNRLYRLNIPGLLP